MTREREKGERDEMGILIELQKISCPSCGKTYSVPPWAKDVHCRVCHSVLPRAQAEDTAPLSELPAAGEIAEAKSAGELAGAKASEKGHAKGNRGHARRPRSA